MPRSVLITQSNAVEGRDEEFNEWYDTRHIPDVLSLPGFVAAQRFLLADLERNASSAFRYLTIYEIEGSLVDALNGLREAVAAGMYVSDALDPVVSSYAYAEMGARVLAGSPEHEAE